MRLTNLIKPKLIMTFLSVVILSACSGGSSSKSKPTPAPQPQPDPTPIVEEVDYQALIDEAANTDIPGIILSIDGPDIEFLGAAGLADTDNQESMQAYHVMPTGSAGKKATALLVAMLHQQNMLDIDAKINTWLPESLLSRIEHSENITLRQLLNHTAGVYDYLDDDSSGDWFDTGFTDVDTLKTDIYALQFALDKPAYFAPGEDFKYSNTGYLLAGLILDEVLGEHHHSELRNRVIEPLGLNDTFYSGLEKDRGDIISGYVDYDGDIINTKLFYKNVGVADAPLSSTVTDMSTLIRAIMTDDSVVTDDIREILLGEESLVAANAAQQFYVGLGMFKSTVNGYTLYHHGGEEAGYKTDNMYISELDTTVTVFFNCFGYDACSIQADALVQEVLGSLLESD